MRAFNRTSTESKCVYRNIFLTESSRYKPHDTIIRGLLACAFCCFQRQQRRLHKRRAFFVRVFWVVLKRVFRGKKLVACFLKLVARILKSEPLIFSLLPCGINALKISFQFFRPKNDNFNGNCILRTDAILSRLINGSSRPLCWFIAPNQFLVAMNRASTGGGCRA